MNYEELERLKKIYLSELEECNYDDAHDLSVEKWNLAREEVYRNGGNWENGPYNPSHLADAYYWEAVMCLAELRELGDEAHRRIENLAENYVLFKYYDGIKHSYNLFYPKRIIVDLEFPFPLKPEKAGELVLPCIERYKNVLKYIN